MAAEETRHAQRMHPDDLAEVMGGLRALMEASAKAPAPSPPPGRPPADLDTFDEQQFKRLKKDLADDVRQIVHDEFEKERAGWLESCRKLIRDEVERIFTLIGLRIDTADKVEETRKFIDATKSLITTTGEFKKEAFSQVLKAFGLWVGGIIAAGLAYIGYKGGGH